MSAYAHQQHSTTPTLAEPPFDHINRSNGAAEASDVTLSPLDRARQALEADDIDRTLMVNKQPY